MKETTITIKIQKENLNDAIEWTFDGVFEKCALEKFWKLYYQKIQTELTRIFEEYLNDLNELSKFLDEIDLPGFFDIFDQDMQSGGWTLSKEEKS